MELMVTDEYALSLKIIFGIFFILFISLFLNFYKKKYELLITNTKILCLSTISVFLTFLLHFVVSLISSGFLYFFLLTIILILILSGLLFKTEQQKFSDIIDKILNIVFLSIIPSFILTFFVTSLYFIYIDNVSFSEAFILQISLYLLFNF